MCHVSPFIRRQGIGYSKDKAEEIFDNIDDDASNQISKDEFVNFFEHGNDELFRKLRYAGIKTKLPKHVPVIKTGTAGPARASATALALQEVSPAAVAQHSNSYMISTTF